MGVLVRHKATKEKFSLAISKRNIIRVTVDVFVIASHINQSDDYNYSNSTTRVSCALLVGSPIVEGLRRSRNCIGSAEGVSLSQGQKLRTNWLQNHCCY